MKDLLAGRVPMMLAAVTTAFPYIKDERLVSTAIGGQARALLLAELSTRIESGCVGFAVISWRGILPAKGALGERIRRHLSSCFTLTLVSVSRTSQLIVACGIAMQFEAKPLLCLREVRRRASLRADRRKCLLEVDVHEDCRRAIELTLPPVSIRPETPPFTSLKSREKYQHEQGRTEQGLVRQLRWRARSVLGSSVAQTSMPDLRQDRDCGSRGDRYGDRHRWLNRRGHATAADGAGLVPTLDRARERMDQS
ncbi:MAG: hypothetical protein ACKVQU_23845 [Burkholderiales bacterium]